MINFTVLTNTLITADFVWFQSRWLPTTTSISLNFSQKPACIDARQMLRAVMNQGLTLIYIRTILIVIAIETYHASLTLVITNEIHAIRAIVVQTRVFKRCRQSRAFVYVRTVCPPIVS